jgi:hypothetical protein
MGCRTNGDDQWPQMGGLACFLATSYKGQLLEITSNLNTNPELKEEINHIMDSVHLEE